MFDGKIFFTIYDLWMLIITLPTQWDVKQNNDVCGNAVLWCWIRTKPQTSKPEGRRKKEKNVKPIRIKLQTVDRRFNT
jgi:hypothetical protein